MERHKCKLCSRTFSNGRALGGHMKAHLATFHLPPKPQPPLSLSHSAAPSFSSNSNSSSEQQQKSLIYVLRDNPKKCFRLTDPEFDTASGSVVQDRESETESRNPTRRRSKRVRRPANLEFKKPRLSFMDSPEPESSVSDTSPEEDVAMCLMMLSRDSWSKNIGITTNITNTVHVDVDVDDVDGDLNVGERSTEIKLRRKHEQCGSCGRTFRSWRALGSHRSICEGLGNDSKTFECPFCRKVFGSGQALGGHKRSHLVPCSSSTANDSSLLRLKQSFIDLNLPAPAEDHDSLSVLSDA